MIALALNGGMITAVNYVMTEKKLKSEHTIRIIIKGMAAKRPLFWVYLVKQIKFLELIYNLDRFTIFDFGGKSAQFQQHHHFDQRICTNYSIVAC